MGQLYFLIKNDQIIANNPGLRTIEKIRSIVVGEESLIERNIAQLAIYFKYAALTSLERSFSKLNMILSDKRTPLKTENFNKLLIISTPL